MTTSEQILQSLARLDPDFPAFAEALPPELLGTGEALPEGLAEDMIAWLRARRPELSSWLEAQEGRQSAAPPGKFAVEPLAAAGVLAAILFLLRSHIKFKGKNFSFEHKPIDKDLLKVWEQLALLLGGNVES